ncbi:protein of unknown function [Granulicella rosea]|uniref:Alpha-L-rhamnosidase six-hairpin glycosidase domain-containing protein n=1 Tax=Granulicella rosea TaxID=474952 RepID=A0A239KN92_9BACT|nr:DUF4450 domain-containing protein [Granulicella rosea]SNT19631.1 protein of unknown function [Granulicella rosea]
MADAGWTRRQFVGGAAALGTLAHLDPAVAQEALPPPAKSQGDSPEITAGGLVPLLESNVARPMRYQPEGAGFFIRNGKEFFNRPLYGPNIPFRVDGGDLPEFSLYLPGHGGNLRLGLARAGHATRWLHEAQDVFTQYVDGRLEYMVRDALAGDGVVSVQVQTEGAGLRIEILSVTAPEGLELVWAFAGVSGRKGKRNGDIGCEVEPVSRFFQVRPEECKGNLWTLKNGVAEVVSGKIALALTASAGAEMRVVDGEAWGRGWDAMWGAQAGLLPALAGRIALTGKAVGLRIQVLAGTILPAAESVLTGEDRSTKLREIARGLSWTTPDAHLDGVAGALNIAADAVWDEAAGCVMHGAVAWRMALAGWRGPYVLDITGRHDRMQRHLRRWLARQNVSDVTNGSGGTASTRGFEGVEEARGAPDKGSANSRSEALLHSNGDLSKNHYDMNLVLFDALLRHLRWTGDLDFAREAWPALERHAAWERRLFRREYGSPAATSPLYEAYAAIWASDNLQYNGGGAAHSSAYNVFLNRGMAQLAELLGKPAAVAQAYRAEADAIRAAMRKHLWMPARGAFAESRDWLGERTLAESPAVWTVYHTIDSEVATRKEAWQMAAERLRAIRRVPVEGEGVPRGGWQMACSDWLPYVWSLTLLTLGENLHMALALFQAGMAVEGYGLLYGSLVDACYRGLCPGNFPMSLQLDPHRQESQRDFADPIGCASRAIVEGLWGVQPDLLAGRLNLRPQLPAAWEKAELRHPELTLLYRREGRPDGAKEIWRIESHLSKPVALRLELPAWMTALPQVNVEDARVSFDPEPVGQPIVVIELAVARSWTLELVWQGEAPIARPRALSCRVGDRIDLPPGARAEAVDDPQGCLDGLNVKKSGTVFVAVEHGECRYWLPIELRLQAAPLPVPLRRGKESFMPVNMDGLLTGQVREIFTRSHAAPRSGLASLNLPDGLLGGWANFDDRTVVDDAGLRKAGGALRLDGGLVFRTPAGLAANCCFLSQWQGDRPSVSLPLSGQAKCIYLLLACTTFPQATRSVHGVVRVGYADGGAPTVVELRSPANWWPVEQDYLVDDYVFRMEPYGEPEVELPLRVDLRTGLSRRLDRTTLKLGGRRVPGGSATVLRVELDARRPLEMLQMRCNLYGVVLGVLGITLGV